MRLVEHRWMVVIYYTTVNSDNGKPEMIMEKNKYIERMKAREEVEK